MNINVKIPHDLGIKAPAFRRSVKRFGNHKLRHQWKMQVHNLERCPEEWDDLTIDVSIFGKQCCHGIPQTLQDVPFSTDNENHQPSRKRKGPVGGYGRKTDYRYSDSNIENPQQLYQERITFQHRHKK